MSDELSGLNTDETNDATDLPATAIVSQDDDGTAAQSPTRQAAFASDTVLPEIVGTAGNDILGQGIGPALLRGGAGDDRYTINDLEDVVVEQPNEGFDRITLEIGISNFIVPENVEQLVLGAGVISATPASTGSKLAGLGDNNIFFSGAGTDFYDGNDGTDTLSYANATAGVEASFLKPTAFNTGGAGTDKIDDMEILIGSDFADVLVGGQGVGNVINGGGGNDLIVGFAGADSLTGGAGADTFMYNSTNFRDSQIGVEDTIEDFQNGTDRIDLTRLRVNSSAITLGNGRLEADVDGDGNPDFAINFSNGVTPNLSDLILAGGPVVTRPEIQLRGNGRDINDGDTSPRPVDLTDFGSINVDSGSATATFAIRNDGDATLELTGARVSISGANTGDFSVTRQPDASVAPGGRTEFDVTFNPSATGSRAAVVEITSNDADEALYNFSIAGNGQDLSGPGPSGRLDVMLIGDSFSIPGRGLPQKLEAALESRDFGNVDIIDLTQSGRNSFGARLEVNEYFDDANPEIPEVAVLAIGINDAIQQQSFNQIENNLDDIIDTLQARGVEVVLAAPEPFFPLKFGNRGFTNSNDQAAFRNIYDDLAASNGVILADDFLDNGLTTNASLLEGDRFHPNPRGVDQILDNILPEVLLAIDRTPGFDSVGGFTVVSSQPASVNVDDIVVTG